MTATPVRTPSDALQIRKQDFVRAAIWDAAIELFAAPGFEETTIDDIARAAGVSTRTFFRYFASKNDLMGQGMVRYRTLLTEAIAGAPRELTPLAIVRYVVEQVASQAASAPRIRQILEIASRSVSAREAQLSRRAEVEDGVADAFAARCRTRSNDQLTPRLLGGLTLSILDVTFRVWSRGEGPIADTVADVFVNLTKLLSPESRAVSKRPRRTGH